MIGLFFLLSHSTHLVTRTSPKIGKDEEHVVKQGQVCRKIKEILEDKINQGKISEKWIEECLPAEYKRKYIKSDLSSLSKQRSKRQLIEVRTGGNQITEQQDEKGIDWPSERQPTNKMQSEDKSEQRRYNNTAFPDPSLVRSYLYTLT